MPNRQETDVLTAPSPEPANLSVAVELARLSGEVRQVINDHERRITNLEAARNGSGMKAAAILSPVIATVAVIITIAVSLSDRIAWQ